MRLVKRPILLLLMCGALGVAACGGGDDDDEGGSADGADGADGADDDGADDDGGSTVDPAGTDNTYVISSVGVPSNSNEATMFGLNIDGMGPGAGVDNKLGNLLGILSAAGLDIQGAVNEQVQQGGIILLANLKATDLTDATGVGFYVYLGDNPNPAACESDADTECGKHLQGDATFDIAADSPTDAVVVGENAGGKFTGGPGDVTLELSLSALADPLSIKLVSAKAEVTVTANGLEQGKLGGAITKDDVDNELIPAVANVLAAILEDSGCTAGGPAPCCPADTTGATVVDFLEDEDCMITPQELADNPLVSSTLGTPDLNLDPADPAADALSLGIGFTAVGGSFTPP